MINKKVRVLVVDDSLVFRETIARGLDRDPGIEVVGTARDAYDARDKIIQFEPDVMTLDVEMPRMNGIEFLRRLMPQYPMPVVMVSAVNENVFEALDAGAVDFVRKPDGSGNLGLESLISELNIKVKIASLARVSHWKKSMDRSPIEKSIAQNNRRVLVIGASTGGTEATARIVQVFPRDFPGTLIVQHMPAGFTRMYAERLNRQCLMEVKEAEDKDRLCPGRMLVAAGDYHMRLRKSGDSYMVECFKGDKVNGHCPSVDVLFDSVAAVAGRNAIGVILTGMGADGAKGLLKMREKGARTIGQDEESCVVYGMPKVAYEIGAVEKQVNLGSIAGTISGWLNG